MCADAKVNDCCSPGAAQFARYQELLSTREESRNLGALLSNSEWAGDDVGDAFDAIIVPLEPLSSPVTRSIPQSSAMPTGDAALAVPMLRDTELPGFDASLPLSSYASAARLALGPLVKSELHSKKRPLLWLTPDRNNLAEAQSVNYQDGGKQLRALDFLQRPSQWSTIGRVARGRGRYRSAKPIFSASQVLDGGELCRFPGCVKQMLLFDKCLVHFGAVACSISGCTAPVRDGNRCHQHLSNAKSMVM